MKNNVLALILLWVASYQIALAENIFKIIELKHHMAQDILPTLQIIVGNNGVVTGLNNQIIIRTDSAHMADIEQAVAALDTSRQNIKITVSHDATHQYQQDSTSAQGNLKIGRVVVSNSRTVPPNNAEINIERNISSMSEHGSQFINVLDGERAFISTGQIIPYTEEWSLLTRRYIQQQKTTVFKEISTGFAVRAHSIGDVNSSEFELEITPRIASINSSGYIDFEELSTLVRVHKGEWFDLGGNMLNRDDVSRQILNTQNQLSQHNSDLMIRIE